MGPVTRAGLWLVGLIDRLVDRFLPVEPRDPRNNLKEWL